MSDRWRRHLEGLLGVPATEGNRVEVLVNGDEIFPAMLAAIREAEVAVDLLTYVYWTGEIAQRMAAALCERAREGCRVRVLLDAVGARRMDRDLVDDLRSAGARVAFFRPPTSWENLAAVEHRTHRRVLICDEQVGFTGGVGIGEEWEGDARDESEWRETHLRVRGPVVDGLRAAFLDSWIETGGELLEVGVDRFPEQPQDGEGSTIQVVQGHNGVGPSATSLLKRALVELAEERLRITTAYFSPDEVMRGLLCGAAERGVDVQLLVPGPHVDKRFAQLAAESDYGALLEAGVSIHHYQPTMLHAKTITVDRAVANVGTSNLDSHSLGLNQEIDLVILDAGVVAELDARFEEDLGRSQPLDLDEWRERGPTQRIAETAVELFDNHI